MRAVFYEKFGSKPVIRNVDDPAPPAGGVVLKTEACGICRSDWHGWMGHDPDIVLPHVPGHELAGTIAETGSGVDKWKPGDRVTLPFVCGCGVCGECLSGNQQVCDNQFQPGFTAWGGFAEYVAIDFADGNLVRIPEEIDSASAASLGCRFITAFRGVVDQGEIKSGDWVAVFGCGGVGLSALMIATALGANTVAIDISRKKLELASRIGAVSTVNASDTDVSNAVRDLTDGGADLAIEAIGDPRACADAVRSLRKRGRLVQIGLLPGTMTPLPMDIVIARELEIFGSHGMQAHRYPELLELIKEGRLRPELLICKTVSLEESIDELLDMQTFGAAGITVIDRF